MIVIVYSFDGAIHDGIGKKVDTKSALMAKALNVKEACFLLKSNRYQAFSIFSDCKEVVDICCSWDDPLGEVNLIISDIHSSLVSSLVGKKVDTKSSLMAEALTVKGAYFLLKSNWYQASCIFADCKEVVDICCSWDDPPGEVSLIISHIHSSMASSLVISSVLLSVISIMQPKL